MDENGVNVVGLGRLVTAIVGEKPDALLFNGDLVGGAKTDAAELSQFDTWKRIMAPIYDAGITVLAARGNHEMGCENPDAVWRQAMSGRYANPQGGPKGEEGMTYAFAMKNVLFVSLDQFETKGLGINQTWLDATMKAPHPPHVFAHKMAFFSGNHTDGMNTVPEARDAMLKSLMEGGARAVFFGHDHLYDHLEAFLPGGAPIHQFVIGTAGAPFVKGKALPTSDGGWAIGRIGHVENALGYMVVDVDGPKVTMVYKSETSPGVFEMADSYTYSVP